jgi:hypothetical protein
VIKVNARRWALGMMMCSVFVAQAMAAPPLTTIQDTLYKADGTLYSGYVQIEWKSFEASDNSLVPAQSLSLRVYRGLFRTQLVPTTTASSGAIYSIRYVSDGRLQGVEYWAVPPASSPVRLTNVRVPPGQATSGGGGGAGGVGGPFEITDIVGLQEALDSRPRKGAGYSPGRAAIINGLGEIESALGADSDCITVEGAGSVCGAVGGLISFVDGEVLTGTVDGVNTVFNLSRPPNPVSSLYLYRNGLFQRNTIDYTLSGTTVTFTANAIPQTGDLVIASYRLSGTGVGAPQVLCSSVGTATSSTSSTTLGTCTITAGTIQPGDRLEISADFTHEGTAQPFTIITKFGTDTLLTRNFLANETNGAVRLSLGRHTANTAFGGQSWGASTSVTGAAGSVSANYTAPLTIDFSGNVAAGTTDGVTLRNYTVVRYPVP